MIYVYCLVVEIRLTAPSGSLDLMQLNPALKFRVDSIEVMLTKTSYGRDFFADLMYVSSLAVYLPTS